MNCPRCGALNHPQAQRCENCGLPLRAPTAPPGMARPSQPGGDDLSTRSGFWDMDVPARSGNMSAPWTMPADPRAMPGGNMGQWGSSPDQRSLTPASSAQWEMPQNLQSSPPYGGDPNSRPVGRPSRPTFSTGGLFPGAMLQGGRLRVLAPYGLTRIQGEQGPPQIVQWVASNVERRSRVVLLEVPLGNMPPGEAQSVREALASRLRIISQHPNLQRAFGSFTEQGRHYLVLEYVEGEFLGEMVRQRGPLPEKILLTYGDQMLDALEFLSHQSPPAIHGLINPETVVLTPDEEQVVLTTWSPHIIARALNITLPGPVTMLGGYNAPEMLRGQVETRGDVYSVGATLYFAATGAEAGSRSAGIFSPARQFNADITPPTEAVLARSVRLVPSQRYQHAEEMRLDIQRANRGESPNRDPLDELEPIFRRRNPVVFTAVGIISLLLVIVLVGVFILRSRTNSLTVAAALPTPTVNPTAAALASLNEGLSSGTFIFNKAAVSFNELGTPTAADTMASQTPAGAVIAELAGAHALQAGNVATAITDFQQAVHDDPTNPEPRIYLADTQIAASHTSNFVTIPVAVSFSGQDIATSLQVLRGVALAQADLNAGSLPGAGKVVIQVASVGADASAAPLVQQYFTQQIANGNPAHDIGVISWSPRAVSDKNNIPLVQALQGLAQAHVPVIAPLTTADAIPTNPYFFQLSPTDKTQGGTLAQVALGKMNTHRPIVIIDKATLRNLEIGKYAAGALQAQLGANNVTVDYIDSTAGSDTAGTAKAAHDAAAAGADLVIFAGDGDGTAALVGALAKINLVVPILASPSADDPALIGQSASATATYAKGNETLMKNVTVLGLADAGEWSYANQPLPPFFNEYGATFTDITTTFTPDAEAIFSYDAIDLMIKTVVSKGFWTANKLPQSQDLRNALAAINDAAPFQGVSGRIAFDSSNVPKNRSLVLKRIAVSSTQTDATGTPLLQWDILAIVPPSSFCATSACTPS